mmetsp:Transcript_35580/g.90465  ORF Transcript_35580/g.90465 Transcript_35580/m.90465 type:complete len:253 (+) Transcript_35580:876-1634(+)
MCALLRKGFMHASNRNIMLASLSLKELLVPGHVLVPRLLLPAEHLLHMLLVSVANRLLVPELLGGEPLVAVSSLLLALQVLLHGALVRGAGLTLALEVLGHGFVVLGTQVSLASHVLPEVGNLLVELLLQGLQTVLHVACVLLEILGMSVGGFPEVALQVCHALFQGRVMLLSSLLAQLLGDRLRLPIPGAALSLVLAVQLVDLAVRGLDLLGVSVVGILQHHLHMDEFLAGRCDLCLNGCLVAQNRGLCFF